MIPSSVFQTNASRSQGKLYVVATPIGNLEDITYRAVRILSEVDLIACEDTRHTAKLLRHYGIQTKLTSYYREKEQKKAKQLVRKLIEGFDVALVSDAGTPAISDPGSILVQLARQHGIRTIPVAGPSSLTAAISVAGLRGTMFFFGGFLPARSAARKTLLNSVAALPYPLIFYESPHRISASLRDCLHVLGERQALLIRELTKIHEEILSGSLTSLVREDSSKFRGELVIIIEGRSEEPRITAQEIDELLRYYRDEQGSSLKTAVQEIVRQYAIPKRTVYQRALDQWHRESKGYADE